MMAGNPNWWSMNGMHPQPHSQFIYGGSNSPLSSSNPNPTELHHPSQDCPVRSWSQLLLGGVGEEERLSLFQQQKKLDNWEDQVLNLIPSFSRNDVKQESSNQINYSHVGEDEFQSNSWTRHHQPAMPASSPTSCTTTLSNSILSFAERKNQHRNHDHSSEKCNSMVGVAKKARVQQSAQPALKVRKEKLGDRITALHQLVSPFGKTDTASVLSEAIGYIRFLQGQIEALSSPYMRNAAGNNTVQHSVQERNCSFLDEAPQFLNDSALNGRGGSKQDSQDRSDLRSRGLCLVPISCTQNVGSENGADYWAPTAFGSGF